MAALAACAGGDDPYRMPPRTPEQVRTQLVALMPATVSDRQGWAGDIQQAFASMKLSPTTANLCAVLSVIEQESTYQADPAVPNLGKVAREEIFKRADAKGVPAFAVRVALQMKSPDGKTYDERLDRVRTERELSRMYEDFIDEVPLGKTLFASWNPVHTAGPMQVSIDYAAQHAKARPYPYTMQGSLRHEVFTRRGGLYFGIAHLLDYPAPYGDQLLWRFADFNAGHYASRNAAFQQAVAIASGRALDLDGDVLTPGAPLDKPGQTELAVRALNPALGLSDTEIRRQLERADDDAFGDGPLATKVYALAERKAGLKLERAAMPRIDLKSPKIQRKLTTGWFANRVNDRHQRCMAKDAARSSARARPVPGYADEG